MHLESATQPEALATVLTFVWLVPRVDPEVQLEVRIQTKALPTVLALEWLLPGVCPSNMSL